MFSSSSRAGCIMRLQPKRKSFIVSFQALLLVTLFRETQTKLISLRTANILATAVCCCLATTDTATDQNYIVTYGNILLLLCVVVVPPQTRLQVRRDGSTGVSPELFKGLYDGVLPPLLAGTPSGEKKKKKKSAYRVRTVIDLHQTFLNYNQTTTVE